MGLFYIHHRWLSFVRKGDHFKLLAAGFILSMFVFRLGNAFLGELSTQVLLLSEQFEISEVDSFRFLLVVSLMGMMAIKLNISPAPLYYEPYRLWPVNKRSLSFQYILLSHLKPANFFWLFTEVVLFIKATEFGLDILPFFIVFWLMQHYWNITLHAYPRLKWSLCVAIMLLATVLYKGWLGLTWVNTVLALTPIVSVIALIGLLGAILVVSKHPETFLIKPRLSTKLFTSGGREFADPLFDLEVKLIWRNKGTRTNLIFGFLAVPILIYYFSNAGLPVGVYFMAIITTGLVLLQHGIYTMSWEGNYFDFLVTRFTALQFMQFKFRFYLWMTSIGLIFSSIALVIDLSQWLPLLAAFMFNISWNCFIVLNGILGNKRKLPLGQSIVMTSESMTANVLIVSFMTIIIPMVLLGVMSVFLKDNLAYYGVIGVSILGLLLKDHILRVIANRMDRKKYELSMAFHD